MSAPVRLAAFAVLLGAVGLAGFGLGSVTGPVGPGGDAGPHGSGQSTMQGEERS